MLDCCVKERRIVVFVHGFERIIEDVDPLAASLRQRRFVPLLNRFWLEIASDVK
jgi:hypothetical protein